MNAIVLVLSVAFSSVVGWTAGARRLPAVLPQRQLVLNTFRVFAVLMCGSFIAAAGSEALNGKVFLMLIDIVYAGVWAWIVHRLWPLRMGASNDVKS